MALDGVLLDLDGTLIDSNDGHVEAWGTAFERRSYRVAADRIAVEVGKGGDKLVAHILGEEAASRDGEALRKAHDAAFKALAHKSGLAVAPGAPELIAALRARGLKVVLATSSSHEQIEVAEKASGVAWRKLVDEVVGSNDVDESKPSPDIVEAAVRRLKMTPAQCVMVGDTQWDSEAAHRAGVAMIGITLTGVDTQRLAPRGARAVYRTPADFLAKLDDALHRASPGPAHVDKKRLDDLIGEALAVAEEAMSHGEVPIGAVIARGDGVIVARGHNRFVETQEKTAHAEIDAFRAARGLLATDARDTILVSSLEPCVMCTGAAMETATDLVLYALGAPSDSGTRRVTPPQSVENQMPRIVGPTRAAESRALLERWLRRDGRCRDQEPYVRQLLAEV